MLTISISESLSMGPEAWSEWNDSSAYLASGDSSAEHSEYTPWGPQTQALSDFDIWKPQPDEHIGQPLWSNASPNFLQEDLDGPWQVPQKLAVEGADVVPISSWASPLRVPLPDPMVHERPLAEDPLFELTETDPTPGLAFARAAWAPASEPQPALSAEARGFIQPPPGLASEPLPAGLTVTTAAGASSTSQKSALDPDADAALPSGMSLCNLEIAGSICTRVEWRIEDLYGKLQASMGRPLVSPPFAALGLPNLRLMVFPDGRDTMKNARSGERKGLYAAMIKKGPLNGALKLKADCLQCATRMTVNLTVGKIRSGPLVYDFSEQAIHGLDDFGADWLKQVDKVSGSLTVGIEILDVRSENQ